MTNKVVFKPRPDCGSCHARATLKRASGRVTLDLVVASGRRTADWTLTGANTPAGVVFAKGKLRLTLADNAISGTFDGRMRARISLKPAPPASEKAKKR